MESIYFEGRDLTALSESELRALRGSGIAMIYQEPTRALNPCMTAGRQLMEVPIIHEGLSREEAYERALELIRNVKIPDPEKVMTRYPHQLSGGQQQRIVIAMALLSNPSLLLLDEPTTGLDVTVEASVVELIADLRERYDTTLLYISHNLGLIVNVCDRVGVMYSGELVEEGDVKQVFKQPRHPYTRGLLDCLPAFRAASTLDPYDRSPDRCRCPSIDSLAVCSVHAVLTSCLDAVTLPEHRWKG